MSILYDPFAEATVVACAIDSAEASVAAHARLGSGDFFDRTLAGLFEVTPKLPTERPDHESVPGLPLLYELRADDAARLSGVPYEEVMALLSVRPVMADTAGTFAERVRLAAAGRAKVAEAEALLAEAHRQGAVSWQ